MQVSQDELFSSLEELLRAQEELLGTLPAADAAQLEQEAATPSAPVLAFMRRVSLTGVQLDRPQDRRVAQNVLNYWAVGLTSSGAHTDEPIPARTDTVLRPFDRRALEQLVARANALLDSFGTAQREFARRVALALIRLRDEKAHFVLLWVPRSRLLELGPPSVGPEVLTAVLEASVVVSRECGGEVEFRFCCEAFLRTSAWTADLVKERVKFRDSALYWEHSGRNSGALLSPRMAAKARADYHDLSSLEDSFTTSALWRDRHFKFAFAGIALLFTSGYLAYGSYFVPWQAARHAAENEKRATAILDQVKSGTLSVDDQATGIRWVADNLDKLYLAKTPLKKLNLTALKADIANMASSEITDVDFSNSSLNGAVLVNATIVGSKFSHATLARSRFDHARISATTFADADLTRAVFSQARLCDVIFTNANVENASFYDASFDLSDPPNFLGSAWWLASGWSLAQSEALQTKYGNDEAFRASEQFRHRLAKARDRVKAASGSKLEQATSNNDLAWLLATYGANLEQAERSARDALSFGEAIENSQHPDKRQALLAGMRDTLGYILLQLNKIEEAKQLLTEAAKATPAAEVTFRNAVALHAAGDDTLAVSELERALKEYLPSHELRNLRGLLGEGAFRDHLTSYMDHGRTPPNAESACNMPSSPVKTP
ncbi:MAG: hypothetical protein NVSMB18_31810 [Acetobacteraceae bacterium]